MKNNADVVTSSQQEREPNSARGVRLAYLVIAWAFLISVAVQVFYAGAAVFVSPTHWQQHTSFVHFFELLPIVLLILALVGRAPRGAGLRALPIWLFALIFLQYFTANISPSMIAALHPVNALVIFWLGIVLTKRAASWRS